jgi:hypothetical protein
MRWLSAVVIALVSAGAHVTGQTASVTPAPAFEVASVKPMANSLPFRFAFRPGAQLSVVNVPLETLVLRRRLCSPPSANNSASGSKEHAAPSAIHHCG